MRRTVTDSGGPEKGAGEKPSLSLACWKWEAGNLQAPQLLQSIMGKSRQERVAGQRKGPSGDGPAHSSGSAAPPPAHLWQVKPVVSQFLREKQLPYNEDSYLARFRLFLHHYEELMVQTPPITELVGLQ